MDSVSGFRRDVGNIVPGVYAPSDAEIQRESILQIVKPRPLGFGPKGRSLSRAGSRRRRLIRLIDPVRLNLRKQPENQLWFSQTSI